MKKYKLDQVFGPAGHSAGLLLFLAGLIISFFSLSGLILLVLGAFVGFTSTFTMVDFEKKKIKYSTHILGIIPAGQWMEITPGMKLSIKKSDKVWRAYSQTNRTLDVDNRDYRIILYDENGKEMMPVQKSATMDAAKQELEKIRKGLDLEVF